MPEGLYRVADLFDTWRAEDPSSAGTTLDFRTWRSVVGTRRRPATLEDALARATHDAVMTRALDERLAGERPTAIMGGHRVARDERTYRDVAHIAHRLASAGLLLLSGGGPGAMEATHLGARLADLDEGAVDEAIDEIGADPEQRRFPFVRGEELLDGHGGADPAAVARMHAWQAPAFALAEATAAVAAPSIGIPTWQHGHEPPTPLATEHAKYFENSLREDGLLAVATAGVVYAPGGPGTLTEAFQDAAQNAYAPAGTPFTTMVFLDVDGHWSRDFPIRAALEKEFEGNAEALARIHWVQTVDEVVDAVLDGAGGLPPTA